MPPPDSLRPQRTGLSHLEAGRVLRLGLRLIGARMLDEDLRRELVRQTARTSLRSNLLSLMLIVLVVRLLHDADTGPWLMIWAGGVLVCLVIFDQGVRWCLRRADAGVWSRPIGAFFALCFAISGASWGSTALLPLRGQSQHQAVAAGIILLAIAAGLVFSAATGLAFTMFNGLVAVIGVIGLLRDGDPDLAALIAFGAIASLPLRGELGEHIVEATLLGRRNITLVSELRAQREQLHEAYLSLSEANVELSLRATRDPLTGLANRDLFAEHLSVAQPRSRAEGSTLSVMYFDLDRFKSVNDSWGHAAGDELLRAVADRLTGSVRGLDLVARMGGDEFTVVTVTAGRPEAMELAERIRACFTEPFELEGHTLRVSTSVGVAFDRPGTSPQQLVSQADAALYRAKELGRDRVHADSAEAGEPPVGVRSSGPG